MTELIRNEGWEADRFADDWAALSADTQPATDQGTLPTPFLVAGESSLELTDPLDTTLDGERIIILDSEEEYPREDQYARI